MKPANFLNLSLSQLGHAVLLAAWTFQMWLPAFPSRDALRVQPAPVTIATGNLFRARLAVVTVAGLTSAFPRAVVHVVNVGSEKQMGRVAAGPIIAGMTDKQAARPHLLLQEVGDGMGRVSQLANAESAVTADEAALPRPAFVRTASHNPGMEAGDVFGEDRGRIHRRFAHPGNVPRFGTTFKPNVTNYLRNVTLA
jgi:hypothetical protein